MRPVFAALFVVAATRCLPGAEAAAAAPSPRQLVEITDLSNLAISPDGAVTAFRRETASVDRNTYDTAWFVVDNGGLGAPRRIGDGGAPLRYSWGTPVMEPPLWSTDGQWLYYRALLGGQVQVWRAKRDGSRAEPVTRDSADVEAFAFSPDGRSLLYTVGATREEIQHAEDAEYDNGIRIDDKVWVGAGLYRSGVINGRLATLHLAGNGFAIEGLLADRPKRHRIVDLASLEARDATAAEQALLVDSEPVRRLKTDANAALISRSPAGGWTAYLAPLPDSGNFTPKKGLSVVSDSDVKKAIHCMAAPCQGADVASLAWRRASREVVFTVIDHERGQAQSLYRWDVASNTVRPIVQAEGFLNGGGADSPATPCAVGARYAVCVGAAANTPPRLERVDLETGARQVLYDPNPSLHDAAAPTVTFMRWTDEHGHAFTGQFYAPPTNPSGKPAPLFITYYACPGYIRGGTGDEWPLAAMAADGIAAICINHPAGWPFEATDRYDTGLSAVRSVIDLLAKQNLIDRTRVGMGGLSFGSEVTTWVAMKSDLLAAASVASPFASQTYYWLMALQGEKQLDTVKKLWGLGSPSETPDRWKLLSPSFNLERLHTPFLMQLPEQEYLVALDYFAPMVRSATPAEMFVYPNETHLKWQPRHKLAIYERNLDWFRFWLQDYVDPDPQKAEQYARWRSEKRRADAARGVATTSDRRRD